MPINLADIVCALVGGWKKDGEWPPRSLEERGSGVVGARRERGVDVRLGGEKVRRGVRRGVGGVRRVLGLGGGGDGEGGDVRDGEGDEEEAGQW